MNAKDYWQMFLETGAPELYLLYNNARKSENGDVFDSPGACPESNSLQ